MHVFVRGFVDVAAPAPAPAPAPISYPAPAPAPVYAATCAEYLTEDGSLCPTGSTLVAEYGSVECVENTCTDVQCCEAGERWLRVSVACGHLC